MSGIETVRVIVEAEKEAAKILEDAQAKATEDKKKLDSLVEQQRKEILESARKEAATVIQRAENDGKVEAVEFEKSSGEKIEQLGAAGGAKKKVAVDKLVDIIMEALR